MLAVPAQDPELIALAKSKGADGINLAGMCCTANEILMRHGVPMAGNFLQQELAIVTGAVDAMVVDVQCIMAGPGGRGRLLPHQADHHRPQGQDHRRQHIEFDEHNPLDVGPRDHEDSRWITSPTERAKVAFPKRQTDLVAGFRHETINYLLGGFFRASYRPLNDNIINGRIRGVAGVVGCNNAA